ncbi:MAG: glycerophosphodiester phosphodiesterase family protein [Pseudomonadales bacterium]|nr:glycerophosphodiester phosphodiesterase family protein [Pseudomonadales bacterium]
MAIGAGATEANIDTTTRALDLSKDLLPGPLQSQLQSCASGPFYSTDFSIAHRGAPLGYPEHSREGYIAAATQGAGVIECDVTFTKDLELVCRHSQCDLATSTNILQTELAASCRVPFTAATNNSTANAQCCTSDITLKEFKTLCARPDRRNPQANTVAEYLAPLQSPVVDSPMSCGTVVSHKESIALIDELGRKFTPELKRPEVPMPFAPGFDQHAYADKMLLEYSELGIDPARVLPQSFSIKDVQYWIKAHPQFAKQTVWLDPRGRQKNFTTSLEEMQAIKGQGINIISPPIPMLIQLNDSGDLEPSNYAKYAKQAGLEIITWTMESGDPIDPKNWLYANIAPIMDKPGKMLEVIDVLAQQVGVRGIFSDWPGTITYYANCQNNLPK